ncbi:unnamed protein product [Rotaria sordida]|uniref:Uncharacterized protein n=1 Tax=Rotaria sordida TaxID=392033 RepID=A0A818TYB7_9BILA|nr:unnamed protein product [Rotaria sordida]CAF3690498.1 unnamed protein product [Rotaria sordida]
MATNNDLDDFFKKKDRKGNKSKKQSGLLTNNQELLKQLEIVTSATTAFKENMDFDDDDELHVNDESLVGTGLTDEIRKHPIKHNKIKNPDNNKNINEQNTIISNEGQQQQQQPQQQQQQQDEWEDFESSNYQYEQLRLKFARINNNDEYDDEYYDDENNPNNNDDNNDISGDRQQQKDKPVWKIDQNKQEKETNVPIIEEKITEQPPPSQPKPSTTSSGVYRPPALRTGSSVTIVSGISQRTSKKKEPNLASTDEFPTLGSAANKK